MHLLWSNNDVLKKKKMGENWSEVAQLETGGAAGIFVAILGPFFAWAVYWNKERVDSSLTGKTKSKKKESFV